VENKIEYEHNENDALVDEALEGTVAESRWGSKILFLEIYSLKQTPYLSTLTVYTIKRTRRPASYFLYHIRVMRVWRIFWQKLASVYITRIWLGSGLFGVLCSPFVTGKCRTSTPHSSGGIPGRKYLPVRSYHSLS
jgi:hypothetical protein